MSYNKFLFNNILCYWILNDKIKAERSSKPKPIQSPYDDNAKLTVGVRSKPNSQYRK